LTQEEIEKIKERRLQEFKIRCLLRQWEKDNLQLTVPVTNGHPAYEELLDIGMPAAILIISDFRRGKVRNHFFSALRRITNANPIPLWHHTDDESIAGNWIRWAIDRKLIQP